LIYWNGCSFVQGMEINKRQNQFPAIVSAHFEQPWLRHSKVGGSNDRIARVVIVDVCSEKGLAGEVQLKSPLTVKKENLKIKLAIIVWSGINRFEYVNPTTNTWRQAAWMHHRMEPQFPFKLSHNSRMFFHPDMDRKMHAGVENYGRNVRYPVYNLRWSMQYMLSVKYILKAHGIPYLFYNLSDGQIKPALKHIDDPHEEGANVTWTQNTMKLNDWYRELPHMKEEAFYDMCKRHKVPFGPKDHPLEEGNRLMADRIIKDIYDKKLDKVFS
jgi:hypothetical protein